MMSTGHSAGKGASGLYSQHMSRLSLAAQPYLDERVDYDHDNTHEDLYEIAYYMVSWDTMAPQLGLTEVDVHDIKRDHLTAREQRIAALSQWKQRKPFDTYHDLLKICCSSGDSKTASVICEIVSRKAKEADPHIAESMASQSREESLPTSKVCQTRSDEPVTMKNLMKWLYPICHKWRMLAVSLGLDDGTISSIERDRSNTDDLLYEVLSKWENNVKADEKNWSTIYFAVKDPPVNEPKIADTIKMEFMS